MITEPLDMSKINKKSLVIFKDGSRVFVEEIFGKEKYHGDYVLRFKGMVGNFTYTPSGKLKVNQTILLNSDMNIIKIGTD